MVQKITWSPIAETTFSEAVSYLEENFSEKEIQKFADRVQQKILVIKSNPRLGRTGEKRNVYKTLVHKKILLFYQHKPVKQEILLLSFWNTQQDPGKLKW